MQDSSLLLLLALIVAGTLANDIWRMAGVWLSRGVNPQSWMIVWVRDISTALVAALVARMLLVPAGALADIPASMRFAAFGTGVIAFLLSGRSLAVALVAGETVLLGAHWF